MGIHLEAREEVPELLMHHHLILNRRHKVRLVLPGWELTFKQQMGHLYVVALPAKVCHWVATVEALPCWAIDVGDSRGATSGTREARIKRESIGLRVEVPDIDEGYVASCRAAVDLQLMLHTVRQDKSGHLVVRLTLLAGLVWEQLRPRTPLNSRPVLDFLPPFLHLHKIRRHDFLVLYHADRRLASHWAPSASRRERSGILQRAGRAAATRGAECPRA
mmetsp:Transcript_11381/g.32021  ORF Transcript_11381/g.32021 Transcript_11381/m.32021 type:complete len:219 (+) Transcript_11381:526-1182(+)